MTTDRSESAADRGRSGRLPAAAETDPVSRLRVELGLVSSAVHGVGEAIRRQQVAMLGVTLALGLFLPVSTVGREQDTVEHHLLGTFALLTDADLRAIGEKHGSRPGSIGRIMMLVGIGLVLIGLLVALAFCRALVESCPERSAARGLSWGAATVLTGVLMVAIGGWAISLRSDLTVVSIGLLFLLIFACLLLTAANDTRQRV